MEAWYLIYSKPQQERVALDNLGRQGYRTYIPLVRVRRRHRGIRRNVVEPMFPRYLFVYLSTRDQDWGPIRSTKGVSRLVRFGGTAAAVPGSLVDALRAREDEHGVQTLPIPTYTQGERVRISEGPMTGYEALFDAATGSERVLLLLDIAGKVARLEIGMEQIESI